MPKPLLWFIGAVVVVILAISFYAGSYPGRVALINQSGRSLTEVTISSAGRRIDVGSLRSGETRIVSLGSGVTVELAFHGRRDMRNWRSIETLRPGQTMMLYITADERVAVGNQLNKRR